MVDVLVRGGDWDTDTQEGRPRRTQGENGHQHARESVIPGNQRSRGLVFNLLLPEWRYKRLQACLAVCGTQRQPWKTNVVTIIKLSRK